MSSPNPFTNHLREAGCEMPRRGAVTVMQVNIGRRCNLACHHCHVEAGPNRTEELSLSAVERVLTLLHDNPCVEVLDLTGGAPEMNPHFRRLVRGARALGRRVIDRSNLTILLEPGYEDLAGFLAENEADIVASLPCTTADNVDAQRGRGVFESSIVAIQQLNALGYGHGGGNRRLDLVYNPLGPTLPPSQSELEAHYRDELRRLYGIEFDSLLAIANMPIKRFAHQLVRDGQLDDYMTLLQNHFNPETLSGLMCRNLLSVAFDGSLYDCDFNQMLGIALHDQPTTIWDLDDLSKLEDTRIATGSHCFGCTAGAGSSCGGALS